MATLEDGLIVDNFLVGITPYSKSRSSEEASPALHEFYAFIPWPCENFGIPFCHRSSFVFANSFLGYEWLNYTLRKYENSTEDKFLTQKPPSTSARAHH